eukprot:2355227-Amphidinium_carterae.1
MGTCMQQHYAKCRPGHSTVPSGTAASHRTAWQWLSVVREPLCFMRRFQYLQGLRNITRKRDRKSTAGISFRFSRAFVLYLFSPLPCS